MNKDPMEVANMALFRAAWGINTHPSPSPYSEHFQLTSGEGERRFGIPPVKGSWNTIEHPRERPLANSLASPTSLLPPLLSHPLSGATAIQRELPPKPSLRGPMGVAPALPAAYDYVGTGVHPLNPITIISDFRGSPKEPQRCPFGMSPTGGEECAKPIYN